MSYASRIDARIREALYAGAIAFVLLLGMVTAPLDELIWTVQSRLQSRDASGEIVFVGSREDLTDPSFPERRERLADALDRLTKSDAERIYIDEAFQRPSTERTDARLRTAMVGLGDRLYLVQSYQTGVDGEDELHRTLPDIATGLRQVGKSNLINFLGYVWDAPYTMAEHGSPLASLPVSLAGITPPAGRDSFPINYGFALRSIPMLEIEDLVSDESGKAARAARTVANRVVLIGNADQLARSAIGVPGHISVPSGLVQIYAAETLKAGLTWRIGGFALLAACLLAIGASLTAPLRRWSNSVFAGLALGLPALVAVTGLFGIQVEVTASLIFLMLYGLLGAKRKWCDRVELTDPATKLPTFAALEACRTVAHEQPTIIVGKIHRLEDIKRTLPDGLLGEYVHRIIERLQLKSAEQTFYIGHGHCLAWCVQERDLRALREHLEGLRALLSAPMQVGTDLVDAGMTFAIDASPSPEVGKRLAAALAVVEQTTEAHNPIATTEIESEEDLLWSISLQARIDAALASGEIYLHYQPKVLIDTGDVIGVEALVRWEDPSKGPIRPDVFIRQCESAGRMLHLTRYVLSEACRTGKDFEGLGRSMPVAVNISATLLHNWKIVSVVRDVLRETLFDPTLLTLEVTETYRISSLETADEVLTQLSALGIKISMDDFGVGAASFEALLSLPFSELKIDRLFVAKIVEDAKAREIVRHMLRLGKDLRIIVVAEGIEDAATLALLRRLGCVVGQGYGIAAPMLPGDLLAFREARRLSAAES